MVLKVEGVAKLKSLPCMQREGIMDKSLECRNPEFSKFGLKESDSARNFGNHSVYRWFDRFPVSSLATLKDMVNDGSRLHTHFRTFGVSSVGYPSEYCAVFYLGSTSKLRRYVLQRDYKSTGLSNGNLEVCNTPDKGDDLNETMFVGIINVSKKRKRRIPCLIRLQALDSCPLNIAQSFDVPSSSFVVESVRTVTDGEVNTPIESRVFEEPKLPEQVVESRPQVVADITNEQGDIGVSLFDLLKPEDALSCLSVSHNLVDNLVGLTLLYPLNQVVDDLEMLLCPAEFEKRAIERMHSKTIQRNRHIV